MCAIAGRLRHRDSRPFDVAAWDSALRSMARRGPDGHGIHIDEHALLGNRRLAIVGDPASSLPLVRGNGRYVLAYNGELYDRRSLAHRVDSLGWPLETDTDSDVLLGLLVLDGREALRDVDGIFALAFYDRFRRTLLLARDHAGVKPLYWRRTSEGLAFSSELETFFHLDGTVHSLTVEATACYLRLGYVPAEIEVAAGVRMLAPGTSLEAHEDGRLVRERYWRLRDQQVCQEPSSIGDTITASIERQLDVAHPVGHFFSGGVDSPLLAALRPTWAARPRAYVVSADDAAIDETARAQRYAERIDADLRVCRMSFRSVRAIFDTAIEATKEPMADEGMLPSLVVSEAARADSPVAISGDGADELFLGYEQRHMPGLAATSGDTLVDTYRQGYAESSDHAFGNAFPSLPDPVTSMLHDIPGSDAVDWIRQCEFETYLPFILLKTDRAAMHHSLEVRVPFLAPSVIRAALTLTQDALVDGPTGRGKLTLRSLLENRTGLRTGDKQGFTIPTRRYLDGPLRPALEEAIDAPRGLSAIDVDLRQLRRMASGLAHATSKDAMLLWRVTVLHHWTTKVERDACAPRQPAGNALHHAVPTSP